ncbi:MAG: magnesium chelatase [Acidobacteria bacterium]|mgnify:CR=1 FL=1|nr:MAG: magnesium chelatase [Acidobacteriota bacterium]
MSTPQTLGELRTSQFSEKRILRRGVKDELRENLLTRLKAKEPVFTGIVGYDDTVIPQLLNAILSRHNFILLGLRGQAKSRILRALAGLLDEQSPYIAGCEIRDNPYAPICRRCKELVAREGDQTPIAWMERDERYVEKLATPDVTIADLIGDIDPIKAARGGHELGSELVIHYGLLPRANRGIFAVNELPDLAGKIQVGLFNIMQEGDVQIKGFPVRLPLDVALVFSANPEDYTARGKIVSPLKDRIGSEIRTHYPATVEEAMAITAQEAWSEREGPELLVPDYIRETAEQIAFIARNDKRVDKRSGVSQRLPISVLENVISNAERRAVLEGSTLAVPRISDIYAAMPSITGKLELEYEGEMKGADAVAREVILSSIAKTFDRYFGATDFKQIVQWFDLGGQITLTDNTRAHDGLKSMEKIQGLIEKTEKVGVGEGEAPEAIVSAAEFILEGLHAHKRIGRTEDRVFTSGEKPRRSERDEAREGFEPDWERSRNRRSFN